MYTPYAKIETLYERNTEKREGIHPGALLPELTLKNPVYGAIKEWVWTEKIDGTSMRVEWEPTHETFGSINGPDVTVWPEKLIIGGKTDKAQLHSDLLTNMQELFTAEKLRAIFPNKAVTFYGEGYGAGIQKIGGTYGPQKRFIGFDIFVHAQGGIFGGWWLSDQDMRAVYEKLYINVVPYVTTCWLETATEYVRDGFQSFVGTGPAEGLVGRPVVPLFDGRGHRLICKLKTVDFDSNVKYPV